MNYTAAFSPLSTLGGQNKKKNFSLADIALYPPVHWWVKGESYSSAVGQPLDEKKFSVARFKASSACHALAFGAQSALWRLTLLELTDFSTLGKMLFDILPSLSHLLPPMLPVLHFHYSLLLSLFYFSPTLAGLQQRAMITGVPLCRKPSTSPG